MADAVSEPVSGAAALPDNNTANNESSPDPATENDDVAPSNPDAASGESGEEVEPVPATTPSAEGADDLTFSVTIESTFADPLPATVVNVSTVAELMQVFTERPETCHVTAFHLEFVEGVPLNRLLELQHIEGVGPGSVFRVVPDAYTDLTAREHVRHLRFLISPQVSSRSYMHVRENPSVMGSVISELQVRALGEELHNLEAQALEALVGDGGDGQAASKEKKGKGKKDDKEVPRMLPAPGLDMMFPPVPDVVPQRIVGEVAFSGWNPPPGKRRLQGDLFYLDVTTMEGTQVVVTASVDGFYVNRSTGPMFNPEAAVNRAHRAHELADTLSGLSPEFRRGFEAVRRIVGNGQHTSDCLPVPNAVPPWAMVDRMHLYSTTRAEEAMVNAAETDVTGQLRDWNEDFQSVWELPQTTPLERLVRDRFVWKTYSDFVDTARKGVKFIVGGSVQPLNPLEAPETHMYLFNNIFFLHTSTDARGVYSAEGQGGDYATYAATMNDLEGIRAFNAAGGSGGLSTVLTAVIDYRGFRLQAQGIIPGVFQRDDGASNVAYGSIDNGKTLKWSEEFHAQLGEIAARINVAERSAVAEDGTAHPLYAGVDTKGIVGTDGRKYVLDLVRPTPRDCNVLDQGNVNALFRRELVRAYQVHLTRKALIEKLQEAAAADGDANGATDDGAADGAADVDQAAVTDGAAAAGAEDGAAAEAEEQGESGEGEEAAAAAETTEAANSINNPLVEVAFNVNAFTGAAAASQDPDTLAEDEAEIRKLGAFLLEVQLPELVNDLAQLHIAPIDGAALTEVCHARGISMRYLGRLRTALRAAGAAPMANLCTVEMITRAASALMGRVLRSTKDAELVHAIAHFFNCLLGKALPRNATWKHRREGADKAGGEATDGPAVAGDPNVVGSSLPDDYTELSHTAIWEAIGAFVERFYGTTLDHNDRGTFYRPAVLRGVCSRVGVQVVARAYTFGPRVHTPLRSDDILDLYPVSRDANPEPREGRDLLETAKLFRQRGNNEVALTYFFQAYQILLSIYGYLHKRIATCHFQISVTLYSLGRTAEAVLHMQKATVIHERCSGLDAIPTALGYKYLSIYSVVLGSFEAAVLYAQRARFIYETSFGPGHPEAAQIEAQIAIYLQDGAFFGAAEAYLKSVLAARLSFCRGPTMRAVADTYHDLASLSARRNDFKAAMGWEQKAITTAEGLGPGAGALVDAFKKVLGEWTDRAVVVEKLVRDGRVSSDAVGPAALIAQHQANTKGGKKNKRRRRKGKGKGGAGNTGGGAGAGGGAGELGSLGNLPVNDLVNFINGGPSAQALRVLNGAEGGSGGKKNRKKKGGQAQPNGASA